MNVIIRKTTEADLPRLDEIFDSARLYMRAKGNMTQWAGATLPYPSAFDIREDMSHGWSRVVERQGRVVATFCMMTSPEPSYSALPQCREPYVTLHRVASDGSVPGIFALAVGYARHCTWMNVMVDTHADNRPMLAAIARAGFEPCGEIMLPDGSPRLAFILLIYRVFQRLGMSTGWVGTWFLRWSVK